MEFEDVKFENEDILTEKDVLLIIAKHLNVIDGKLERILEIMKLRDERNR